jgi:hypothetical protein
VKNTANGAEKKGTGEDPVTERGAGAKSTCNLCRAEIIFTRQAQALSLIEPKPEQCDEELDLAIHSTMKIRTSPVVLSLTNQEDCHTTKRTCKCTCV